MIRHKIKPLALQSKEKPGRNRNPDATEMLGKSLLRKRRLVCRRFAPTLVKRLGVVMDAAKQ